MNASYNPATSTPAANDRQDTICEMFRTQVKENPEHIAVFDSRRELSLRDLDKLADTLAESFPVKRPRFVGVVMDHSAEMIASIFAILKSGAAYVPVEPTFPTDRIRFILEEANVDFVITNKSHLHLTKGFTQMTVKSGEAINRHALPVGNNSRPDSPAYVLYTSGTTGTPKGVVIENRNVCHYVRAFKNEFNVGPSDTMLQYSVCTFDIFVEEVFTTILNGATLAIPPEEVRDDITKTLLFAERNNVTEISGFPYLLLEMNKLGSIPRCIRLLISGGDILRAAYVDKLIDKVEIYNTYGPSETTVCASYFRCNGHQPLADGTYPIGKEVKGAEILILDKDMKPVPDGTTGEICILGGGVGRGYLRENPESRNFTTMSDGRRVYRSGDLGYRMPDGNIAFLHRKDTQVMILGKRVECEEIENVLCNCQEVEQGVVCPFTDNQGLSYLVAYIVPKARFSLHRLKEKLSKFLTPFMIPEFFVSMGHMPLTPNGKVDRHALPVILKDSEL